ncbi:MAG TPA: tetratricopeptide repeat protein [Stellaceae bacterium]|nr:tetratricopeptide repeat protein [Stellaceae bacterium]
MSFDHNYPQLAIDQSTFTDALGNGALDICLDYLRRSEIDGTEGARLACRLGEKLFHAGRAGDAVECGRLAFFAAANDNDVAHFCAWLFSNSGCHAEAAAAYEQLIADRPDWVEGYRHASGAFAAIGAGDRAIELATRASDLAPANFDFAYHAGCLLLDAERIEEASIYLTRAVAIEPQSAGALRALSAAGHALDRPDEALALALRALALAPDDNGLAIHAAELLLRAGRIDEATGLLEAATTRDPKNAILWRLVSAAESQRDNPQAALAAVDIALHLAPDEAEYHLHRGHLLYRAGDFAAASEALNQAAALDPKSQAARRGQLDLLLAEGQIAEATALGGEILRAFPEDESSAEAVLRVLHRRLDTIDGDYVVLGGHAHRTPRPPRPTPGLAGRLKTQARVVHALIIRETRTRFGDSRLGYGWALIEPILHIVLLAAMFSLLLRGQPPIGTHFFVFYYTGLVPYLVFVHASTSMMHAVTSNGALLQLPPVRPLDAILARGLLEFATDVVVAVLILAGFAALGVPAMPDDLGGAATAVIVTAVLGCGVGVVNAVLQTVLRSWDRLWNNVTRLLYFFSGIFYVPGMMPDWARDILAWNPLLHAIDWFRAGFFTSYEPHWLDRRYLAVCAVLAVLAGLTLERGLRRRLLSEPA